MHTGAEAESGALAVRAPAKACAVNGVPASTTRRAALYSQGSFLMAGHVKAGQMQKGVGVASQTHTAGRASGARQKGMPLEVHRGGRHTRYVVGWATRQAGRQAGRPGSPPRKGERKEKEQERERERGSREQGEHPALLPAS